ncbi:MAG TPA: LuxR family transcriptional regulator, partial [Marmoricola sp.]|nr:LuxR family transcriptional regulator [Marmoricola sp.]
MSREVPDFGPAQRALLEQTAGEIYREAAEQGVIARSDERYAADSDLRGAVDLLVDLGLLSEGRDGWHAVDPTLVQARVVAPLSNQAAELMAESAQWAATFTDLSQAYRQHSHDDEAVTRIAGRANINRFLESVVGDAHTELLTAQPDGPRPSDQLAVAIERDRRALERGVSLRTLYQHSARRSTTTQDYVSEVAALGAQVRTLDEFFKRLIVVDRRLAVIPAPDDPAVAIAIHEPDLVTYLVDIFERYWERGTDFADRQEETERSIAEDVREMTKRMLIEGHSDSASAKRMGVGIRTYANYVAALKAEYGVETRFQLGHAMGLQERPTEKG